MKTDKPDWHFLVNPAAGQGKARRQWQKLLPRLQAAFPRMTWAESSDRTGMKQLAEAAVRAGHVWLVGVGGDGTHHDIINGIVATGAMEEVTYAPLPLGTGNDWIRSIGIPKNMDRWLQLMHYGDTISHAVGKLTYFDRTSPEVTSVKKVSYFLNVAGMAYDSVVVRYSDQARYKHRLLYPLSTLLYLKSFTVPTVRIDYDGKSFTGPVHTINFGIGRYSGGGMRLVPHADPEADTLALTFARQLPVWKILLESWRFYAGSIGQLTEVTTDHVRRVTVAAIAGTAELEADGEWLGVAPVEVSLLPERLRVITDGYRIGSAFT